MRFHGPPVRSPNIRVLVVEASEFIRSEMIRALHTTDGIDVVAASIDQGLISAIAEAGLVDVVIIDLYMPIADGLAILHKLSSIKRDLAIVLTSSITARTNDYCAGSRPRTAAHRVEKPPIFGGTPAARFLSDLVQAVREIRPYGKFPPIDVSL